jgi:hypothetical protein
MTLRHASPTKCEISVGIRHHWRFALPDRSYSSVRCFFPDRCIVFTDSRVEPHSARDFRDGIDGPSLPPGDFVSEVTDITVTRPAQGYSRRWLSPTPRRLRCPSLRPRAKYPFRCHARRRKNEGRSSTQYRAHAFEPALRRQNPIWQALPITSG